MANVNPRQYEFGMVARKLARLEDDFAREARPARTACKPRGAERALPVTTVLDLEPTPGSTLAPVQDGRPDRFQTRPIQPWIHPELKEGSATCATSLARACHGSGDLKGVVSRHDAGHTFHLGILAGPKYSRTPGNDDPGLRIFSLEAPNKTPRLGVCRVRHGTGIHHTNVGRAYVVGGDDASSL
jgi:hypothetical protein